MATETEQAPAAQTQPPTATENPQGTAADTLPTEGPETAAPRATPPVSVFKKFSADELASLQDGFRAKLTTNPRVGHDATLNGQQPKGDTLPIEDAPAETPVETAPVVEAPPAETPAEPAPVEAIDDEGEPVETPPATNGKPPQRRVRGDNPVEDMALSIKQTAARNGRPMSLTQAETEAKRILGVTDAEPAPAQLKSVDALQAELVDLRSKRKDARASFDPEAVEAAESAVEDKILEIERTERLELARQQQEQAQMANIAVTAQQEAVRLYPDLKNDGKQGRAESELHKAARLIHAELVESGDPAVHEPDYHLDLARRAAKATSTAPATVPKVTKPTASRPSVTPPAKPTAVITSASARTSPTSQATNLKVGIQKASPRQIESLRDKIADLVESRRR